MKWSEDASEGALEGVSTARCATIVGARPAVEEDAARGTSRVEEQTRPGSSSPSNATGGPAWESEESGGLSRCERPIDEPVDGAVKMPT